MKMNNKYLKQLKNMLSIELFCGKTETSRCNNYESTYI